MERKDADKIVKSLDISQERKNWLDVYIDNHLNAENAPPVEVEQKPELSHFEVHDVMKSLWTDRNKNVY